MIVMEFAILFTKWLTNQQGQACMTFSIQLVKKRMKLDHMTKYNKVSQ